MTPGEAFKAGYQRCDAYHYSNARLEDLMAGKIPDVWETPAEIGQYHNPICRELALIVVSYAALRCPEGDYRLVVGTMNGGGHAWAEAVLPQGTVMWTDPTNHQEPAPREWFTDRIPWESYRWNGEVLAEGFRFERAG